MKTQILPSCCFLILLSTGCACTPVDNAEADERLTFTTPRREYLRGEPVLFGLTFRNRAKDTIKISAVSVTPGYYEAPLWIASADDGFKKFVPQITIRTQSFKFQSVGPGESLHYRYAVFARLEPEIDLVFAKPGKYRVYAEYPLNVVGDAEKNGRFYSNVVEVRITEPLGEDVNVWRSLDVAAFHKLLQNQRVYEQDKDDAVEMAKLLRANPNSGYAPAMRHTLAKMYFDRNGYGLPPKDWGTIAQILGINEVTSFNDKRLAVRRNAFPNETAATLLDKRPVEQILKVLGEASGVSLDAPKEIKSSKAECSVIVVKDCMQSIGDQLEASWERRGDGYFLVPFHAEKSVEAKKDKQ